MPVYDYDGSTQRTIGTIYDNNGSTNSQIKTGYDNDGTALWSNKNIYNLYKMIRIIACSF